MVFASLAFGVLFYAPQVLAYDALIVGNSYMFANGNKTASVAEYCLEENTTPWVEAAIATIAKGGWTFKKHAADATKSGQQLGSWLSEGADKSVDAVFLQEQSQTPGFACVNDTLYVQSLEGAEVLNQLIEEKGASTWFIMTWGRRNGDSMNSFLYPDFVEMQACIELGYNTYRSELSTQERPVYVVPAGLAWKWIYEDHLSKGEDPLDATSLFHRLYTGDGSHPSNQGSVLNGLVLYASMTGRSPLDGDMAFNGVNETDLALMRTAAHDVVFGTNFANVPSVSGDVVPYPWVIPWSQNDLNFDGYAVMLGDSMSIPTYLVTSPVEFVGDVWVGMMEEPPRDGRLIIKAGGQLNVNSIQVGGSYSSVFMDGGDLFVSNIQGSFQQAGGHWSSEKAIMLSGDWVMGPDAQLSVLTAPPEVGNSLMKVGGKATVSGTINFPSSAQDYIAMEAGEISMQGELIDEDGENLIWELMTDNTGGQQLVVKASVIEEEADAVTEPEEEEDVTEAEDSSDDSQGPVDVSEEEGGEGEDSEESSDDLDSEQKIDSESEDGLQTDIDGEDEVSGAEPDTGSEGDTAKEDDSSERMEPSETTISERESEAESLDDGESLGDANDSVESGEPVVLEIGGRSGDGCRSSGSHFGVLGVLAFLLLMFRRESRQWAPKRERWGTRTSEPK